MCGLGKRNIPINCSCTYSTPHTNCNTVYGTWWINMEELLLWVSIYPLSVKQISPVLGTSMGAVSPSCTPRKHTSHHSCYAIRFCEIHLYFSHFLPMTQIRSFDRSASRVVEWAKFGTISEKIKLDYVVNWWNQFVLVASKITRRMRRRLRMAYTVT
jgi:hypothetical protein